MSVLGRLAVILSLDAQEFRKGADDAADAIGRMSGSFVGAGAALSAAVTAPLVGVGLASVQAASQMETAAIALRNMTGSAEVAGNLLKDLRAFAATTPFEFKDLLEATRRMVALGFSAKDTIPIMRTLGDAVAAMGGGSELINRVTLALGQMQQKGRVTAEEMRQLTETGVVGWQALADKLGVTIPEAMKLAERGMISASTGIAALLEAMQKKFGGAMQEMQETATARWSNIKDRLFDTLARLGEALLPVAKTILDAIGPALDFLAGLAEKFGALPAPIQFVVVALLGLAAAIGPLLALIGAMASGFSAVVGVLGSAGLAGALAFLLPVLKAIVIAWAAWTAAKWLAEFPLVRKILDAISGAVETLIGWIMKIPGVSKLVEEARAAWEKLKGAVTGASAAQKEQAAGGRQLSDVLADLTAKHGTLATATAQTAKKKTEAAEAARSFAQANEILVAQVRMVAEEHKRLVKEIAALQSKLEESRTAFDVAAEGVGALTKRLEESGAIGATSLKQIGEHAQDVFTALGATGSSEIDRVRRAFETLGVKSATDLEEQRRRAIEAYETIRTSGVASADEIKAAYDALQKVLKNDEPLTNLQNNFRKSMQEVSTAVTNAAQDIAAILIGTKEGSILSALERLGEMIVAKLVEPFVQAFEDIIERGVKKLVNWLLDKLLDALEKVAGKIFGIFGGGGIFGGAGTGGGGAPAGGGGAPGGGIGGAVGGAVGGAAAGAASGVVGIITGAVTAVTGVIGVIQQRGQGRTLDLIEENTRFTQIALIGPGGVIDILWQINFAAWNIRSVLFDNILERLVYIGDVLGGFIFPVLKDDIGGVLKDIAARPAVNVTIEGNVIGQEEFVSQLANMIMQRLQLAGARP